MNDRTLKPAEAEKAFWSALKDHGVGMLGLDQPGYHAQPMSAFRDDDEHAVWFFTRSDTDLARDTDLPGGQSAMFTYASKDQEVWACIHGQLTIDHDRERIDRFWNPVAAAWNPGGKDDPNLTLMRFEPDDGRVWVSRAGPVRFFFEIARANLADEQPRLGGVSDVDLR